MRVVRVSRWINAPPEAIFDLLASPTRHSSFDGSGNVRSVRRAPQRLSLGAKFTMGMYDRVSYATTNVVVAYCENRTIAWHHFARFIWRYDLTPVREGTTVTELFDYSVPWGVFVIPLALPNRNRLGMQRTLDRIAELVER